MVLGVQAEKDAQEKSLFVELLTAQEAGSQFSWTDQ